MLSSLPTCVLIPITCSSNHHHLDFTSMKKTKTGPRSSSHGKVAFIWILNFERKMCVYTYTQIVSRSLPSCHVCWPQHDNNVVIITEKISWVLPRTGWSQFGSGLHGKMKTDGWVSEVFVCFGEFEKLSYFWVMVVICAFYYAFPIKNVKQLLKV